jgi:hypothetical protein
VITNPTNLYSQELIKSMDVALSFHIGLMSRMQARGARDRVSSDGTVRELLRRVDVASESLDRAKEVEDFQAVGMRLRELLLTLAAKLSELSFNHWAVRTRPRRQILRHGQMFVRTRLQAARVLSIYERS